MNPHLRPGRGDQRAVPARVVVVAVGVQDETDIRKGTAVGFERGRDVLARCVVDTRVNDGEGVALQQVQLRVAPLPPIATDLHDPRMKPKLVVRLHMHPLPTHDLGA